MKRIIILIIFIIYCFNLNAQDISFNAEISGIDSAQILVMVLPWKEGEKPIIENVTCKNGKFEYHTNLKIDMWHCVNLYSDAFNSIFGNDKQVKGDLQNREITFLIEPGDHLNISAKVEEFGIKYQVSGNSINCERNEFEKYTFPLSEAYNQLFIKLKNIQNDSSNTEYLETKKSLDAITIETANVELNLIKKHPNWLYSAYMITKYPVDTLYKYFDAFNDTVKSSFWGQLISKTLYNAEVDKQVPDFSLLDKNDNKITLSSFLGKYVVIDFWGTWCSGCIKDLPNLRNQYLRYSNDDIVFISICCHDNKNSWLKGIEKYKIDWINLIALDEDIITRYGITGFPTKIFIDKTGKIIKKSIGIDKEFYLAIEKEMKNNNR